MDPAYNIAKKHLFRPLDYHGCADFISCCQLLGPLKGMRILDISSHQWFLLCLAKLHPDTKFVYCTILEKDIEPFQILANINSILNIQFKQQDARNLDFKNEYFDKAVSISVLEHIYPEESGDIIALKEIRRVLKKSGDLIALIPYKNKSNIVYIDGPIYERTEDGRNFFAREYDKYTLKNLLDEVDMEMVQTLYISEKKGLLSLDYLIYGPGEGKSFSKIILNILKRFEKRMGKSIENYLAYHYLRISEYETNRLINIAIKLKYN